MPAKSLAVEFRREEDRRNFFSDRPMPQAGCCGRHRDRWQADLPQTLRAREYGASGRAVALDPGAHLFHDLAFRLSRLYAPVRGRKGGARRSDRQACVGAPSGVPEREHSPAHGSHERHTRRQRHLLGVSTAQACRRRAPTSFRFIAISTTRTRRQAPPGATPMVAICF